MDDILRKLVDEAYQHILHTANGVLRNCRTFNIEILQLEDPSYEEIAEQITVIAGILETISTAFPDDPEGYHRASKAMEYAFQITRIAKAIRRGNEELLEKLTGELDGRPFV